MLPERLMSPRLRTVRSTYSQRPRSLESEQSSHTPPLTSTLRALSLKRMVLKFSVSPVSSTDVPRRPVSE